MAKVSFRRTESSENLPDIVDGQFIVTKDGKAYVDYDEERIGLGGTPDIQMSNTSHNVVENKVIKEYVDNKVNVVDTMEATGNNDVANVGTVKSYVDNKLNLVEGEEVIIGKIFGKTYYEKAIKVTMALEKGGGNNKNLIPHNIDNLDYIWEFTFSGGAYVMPYMYSWDGNGLNWVGLYSYDGTHLKMSTNENWSSREWRAIIRYTKTTDEVVE